MENSASDFFDFFTRPILNSPYEIPTRHWELDEVTKQPTRRIVERRRKADFYTPIPNPRKQRYDPRQKNIFDGADEISTDEKEYGVTAIIDQIREHVGAWRKISDPSKWGVTPETARLLQHWRHYDFSGIRPFFCQVEAAETLIWLTEAAPNIRDCKFILEHLKNANAEANPELSRIALKLATGAGKTTVMAMLIAWQTINAIRRPQSRRFTRGFLIVTPGITIKDRLRVLLPNDPDSYYAQRELVPADMREDIKRAKIVITNYHAFKLRERIDISRAGRGLLRGRHSGEFCRVVESHPRIFSYAKNHNLGFDVPYRFGGISKKYVPDFIVLMDDGRGADDLLRLVIEIKGYRGEDAKAKKDAMDTFWIPGVNALGTFGRWAFAEFTDVFSIKDDFDKLVNEVIGRD